MTFSLEQKAEKLLRYLSIKHNSVCALSGGVDSAVLAMALKKSAAREIQTVTITSPYSIPGEGDEAAAWAASLGIPHGNITLEMPGELKTNPENRCYFCKKFLLREIRTHFPNSVFFMEGTNASEAQGHRPGLQAVREEGFLSPFLENGFTQQEVRDLGREWGLPFWNKPSNSCGLTRLPVNQAPDLTILGDVFVLEKAAETAGFPGTRIRFSPEHLSVELRGEFLEDPAGIQKLIDTINTLCREKHLPGAIVNPRGYRPWTPQGAANHE